MNFFSLLTILFIGLKLTNYINWSWLIVLSPVLIPISIAIGALILIPTGIFLYAIIVVAISEILKIIKK
jgi:hypothetical protein